MVVLVLLWGDSIVESFLFVLHYRETLSAGLLNSFKKQEAFAINVRRDVKVGHFYVQKKSARHGRQLQEFQEKLCDI
jgi:hypothetical protein